MNTSKFSRTQEPIFSGNDKNQPDPSARRRINAIGFRFGTDVAKQVIELLCGGVFPLQKGGYYYRGWASEADTDAQRVLKKFVWHGQNSENDLDPIHTLLVNAKEGDDFESIDDLLNLKESQRGPAEEVEKER